MINLKHPLVKLAEMMDCDLIEKAFGSHFASSTGRPALSPRLVAGLLYPSVACTLVNAPVFLTNQAPAIKYLDGLIRRDGTDLNHQITP
jgi:hypothetical protein